MNKTSIFLYMHNMLNPEKPVFTIGAVAQYLGIKPRMLRFYEERGVIKPSRTIGNRRLYSLNDIDVLSYIHYLTCVKRVNLAGVLEIQRILDKLDPETRKSFIDEIGQKIDRLSKEEKQAYTVSTEKIEQEIIENAQNLSCDPLKDFSPT